MKKTISTRKGLIFILCPLLFLMGCNLSNAQWLKSGSRIYTSSTNNPIIQIRDAVGNNSSNAAKLEFLERSGGSYNGGAYLLWNGSSNRLLIGTKNGGTDSPAMTITRSGNRVGIGTTNPSVGFLLSVNGRIKSKGVLCSVAGWADYVFKEDYYLRPLTEVEQFIDRNGHLPEIPSEKEVIENGIELEVMDKKLLQKIEELTLYLIAQQKEIALLKQRLESLKQ